MGKQRAYGIDLGTTYSCIAVVDQYGHPQIINNAENESTTPSVVFFETPENIVVGKAAKENIHIYPKQTVSTIKRSMGKSDVLISIFGRDYTPQEISARILMKVVHDAEQIIGENIEDVVISCPAYFTDPQKQATKQAGQIAGLNVLYIIPEPTAAAFTYGITQNEDQVVLVYDLGGGTFDITVMEIKNKKINMVALGGDYELGGKNWDDAIVEYFAALIGEKVGASAEDVIKDENYQELANLAELCKIRLSSLQKWEKNFAFKGENIKLELTRSKFDEITRNWLENTINLTNKVIAQAASKGFSKIDKLLLVGGSTFMPQVVERLKKEYSFEIKQFQPNEAVALGAAHMAHKFHLEEEIRIIIGEITGQKTEDVKIENVSESIKEKAEKEVAQKTGYSLPDIRQITDTVIKNAASRSVGIVIIDDATDKEAVDNLVCIHSSLPWKCTKMYRTHGVWQKGISLRIMHNERVTKSDEFIPLEECIELRGEELTFERALPKGSPIEVNFNLSADGLLTLDAKDLTTGREIHIEEERKGLLTEEQLNDAKALARESKII
jgi:molecular chaperone DnaK